MKWRLVEHLAGQDESKDVLVDHSTNHRWLDDIIEKVGGDLKGAWKTDERLLKEAGERYL